MAYEHLFLSFIYHGIGSKCNSIAINVPVDPHFSRASPLNQQDSLFIWWKINFWKKLESPLILFYFKGKIKQERKTLKKWLHNFWKSVSLENPSLGPGIRLLIGKVLLGGSTPLSPIKVSTDKVKGSEVINQLIMDT